MNKQWRASDEEVRKRRKRIQDDINDEIREGNKWLMEVMKEERRAIEEAEKAAARAKRDVERAAKRQKKATD